MVELSSKAEFKQKVQALAEKAQGMHWREIRRLDPALFDEIKKRYGSLRRAFVKLGIEVRMKGGGRQKGPYNWTKESILKHLKEFIGTRESVEIMEIYKAGSYLYKKTIQYFGSLEEALKQDPDLQNVKIIRREKGRKPIPLSKETKLMLENLWRGVYEGAGGDEQRMAPADILKMYVDLYGSAEAAAQYLDISVDELQEKIAIPVPPTAA